MSFVGLGSFSVESFSELGGGEEGGGACALFGCLVLRDIYEGKLSSYVNAIAECIAPRHQMRGYVRSPKDFPSRQRIVFAIVTKSGWGWNLRGYQ